MTRTFSLLLIFSILLLISCSPSEKENPPPADTGSGVMTPAVPSDGNEEEDVRRDDSNEKEETPEKGSIPVEPKPEVERIRFTKGSTGAEVKGELKGYEVREYLLGAKGGQMMGVNLRSDNRFAFFTIEHQGTGERIYDGSTEGMQSFFMELPHDGDYRISILLPRAEARRNGEAHYTIEVDIQ